MKITIDDEVLEDGDFKVETHSDLPMIVIGSREYYVAADSDSAGEAVRKRWVDMQKHDKGEFRCMIGDERLIQWACGESDSFGISSFDDFLDAIAHVPEEELASYDGNELEVTDADEELIDELGFTPTVAYRHN